MDNDATEVDFACMFKFVFCVHVEKCLFLNP